MTAIPTPIQAVEPFDNLRSSAYHPSCYVSVELKKKKKSEWILEYDIDLGDVRLWIMITYQ